jgi:hypothetical protein
VEEGRATGGHWREGEAEEDVEPHRYLGRMLSLPQASKLFRCTLDIGSHMYKLVRYSGYLATVPGRLDDNIFGPC